jgi:hypothetical protein
MSNVAAARPEGLILGRYRVLRPLGSGGSGSVWLARDEVEERDVALKVVPREGKAGTRAEREAQAVARLRTRRCARVYSVARDERHVYVAYEYVPGRTLRQAMRSGELSDRAAVEAAIQVLEALAHAHDRGIIHRDVKPANILLEEADGVAVRLLDFGLAQLDEAEPLTAVGDVPGTLAYISPERLDGHEAEGSADVWAVGVILWEALAGYHPFFSASPVETARRIATGAPSLVNVRPDLPKRLAAAVDRALAPKPRRRPDPRRMAAELVEALAERSHGRRTRATLSRSELLEHAAPAGLAAAFVALGATLLPFYPSSWVLVLAPLVAAISLVFPRGGLALALAVPILPAGNISIALAVVYTVCALAWLGLWWRFPRQALLCVAGPLLAFVGALALVPLVAERASRAWRRALQATAALLLAALVAGLRGTGIPFSDAPAPLGLGLAGSESPGAVAAAFGNALADQRAFAITAAVLVAVSVALPYARGRGLPGIAAVCSLMLVAGVLAPPLSGAGRVELFPVVLGTLGVGAALALPALRNRRGSRAAPVQ